MTQDTDTLFRLLRKANRRRKRVEQKCKWLEQRLRKASDDTIKSLESRHRTIEEQWEIMRELQRRGLVSREDMERVIMDVTKAPIPKFSQG